jgi:hypothetical protein
MSGKRVLGVENHDIIRPLPSREEIRQAARTLDEARNEETRQQARAASEGGRLDRFYTVARAGLAGTFNELAGSIQNESSSRPAWDDLPETVQRSLVASVQPLITGFALNNVLAAQDVAKTFWLNLGRTWTGEPTSDSRHPMLPSRRSYGEAGPKVTPAARIATVQTNNEKYRAQKAAGTQDASLPVVNKRPSVADIQKRNEEYRQAKRSGQRV